MCKHEILNDDDSTRSTQRRQGIWRAKAVRIKDYQIISRTQSVLAAFNGDQVHNAVVGAYDLDAPL